MAEERRPDIKRMLGVTPGMGKALGLDEKWAYNAIKPVGNYGEIFDRNARQGLAAEAGARPERSVDQGRPDVRDADPLSRQRAVEGSGDDERRTAVPRHRAGAAPRRGATRRSAASPIRCCSSPRSSRSARSSSTTRWSTCSRQNIATGFGFLDREAAFGIGESLIAYSPADTYGRAFLVGLTNTLYVAGARHRAGDDPRHGDGAGAAVEQLADRASWRRSMSRPSATSRCCCSCSSGGGCCDESAPAPRQAWQPLPDVFVSNRGIVFPVPSRDPAYRLDGCWRSCVGDRRDGRRSPAGRGQRQARDRAAIPDRLGRARADRRAAAASSFSAAGAPLPLDCAELQGLQLRRRQRGVAGIRRAVARARRSTPARLSPRSSAPASSRSAGARARRRWRSACAAASGCAWSCCRRRCASSSRR